MDSSERPIRFLPTADQLLADPARYSVVVYEMGYPTARGEVLLVQETTAWRAFDVLRVLYGKVDNPDRVQMRQCCASGEAAELGCTSIMNQLNEGWRWADVWARAPKRRDG